MSEGHSDNPADQLLAAWAAGGKEIVHAVEAVCLVLGDAFIQVLDWLDEVCFSILDQWSELYARRIDEMCRNDAP